MIFGSMSVPIHRPGKYEGQIYADKRGSKVRTKMRSTVAAKQRKSPGIAGEATIIYRKATLCLMRYVSYDIE